MYDIIIIGAGPAGLTAAIYALRGNKKVLVLEEKSYGGQIINASNIENYPGIKEISGFDYATTLYDQVINFGGEIKYESVTHITDNKEVETSSNTYKAKAIIIANGVERKVLGLPREQELVGKGISYCATCDGNFFRGKDVAVVGGGNTALEDAIYLSNIASKVYLIHRRDSFRGEDRYVSELRSKENVELVLNTNITKLNGENILDSIELDNGNTIKVNGLFIAIGQTPKNERFENVVELNEEGYIKTFDGVHTSSPHIYVAGDTREKDLRQLTTAVADGSIAATFAIKDNN